MDEKPIDMMDLDEVLAVVGDLPNQAYEPTDVCSCGHPASDHGPMDTQGWTPDFHVEAGCLKCPSGNYQCLQFNIKVSGKLTFRLSADARKAMLEAIKTKEPTCPQ